MISRVSEEGLRRSNNDRFWIGLYRKLDVLIITLGTERTHQGGRQLPPPGGARPCRVRIQFPRAVEDPVEDQWRITLHGLGAISSEVPPPVEDVEDPKPYSPMGSEEKELPPTPLFFWLRV